MSKDEPNNPMDDLQKQLQSLLKNSNGIPLNFQSPSTEQENNDSKDSSEENPEDPILKKIRHFHRKPKEVRDYLNRFVIKQQEAKKVLSVAICDHYNHIRRCLEDPKLREREYNKPNILLLGPTGVGKTFLMRNIAKLIGVPFVKADATKFSETGYVGNDVDDLIRDLVKAANGNIELAQYGIIYIDEIDKIATEGSGGRDVSGRGVQLNLLKLMEETDVNLFSPTDMMAQMQAMMEMSRSGQKPTKKTINTRHILFIVSGAFDQLAEKVKKRVQNSSIGFNSEPEPETEDLYQFLQKTETRDFINHGFEPEFIGRLPVRVACEALKAADLEEILVTSEGSILKQYQADFSGYEITLDIDAKAIKKIATLAAKENTGARGLMTILEKTFRDFKFELPSSGIEKFTVSPTTIDSPKESLKELLKREFPKQKKALLKDIDRFIKRFFQEHQIKLEFSSEAKDALIEKAQQEDQTVLAMSEKLFKDFQHGLKIIQRNTDESTFEIDLDTIQNPDQALSQKVVASFKKDADT